MSRSIALGALVFSLSVLAVTSDSSAQPSHFEDFNTTTYRDASNTTADWNTTDGELKLFPFVPVLVGTYDTLGNAQSVTVAGNLAFVADIAAGLKVIDISNPANPALIGSYDTPSNALGVTVAGDLAFVADDNTGLLLIDISDPANPALTGSYDTPGSAKGIAVAGDLAFVADGYSGLLVIDISDPVLPTLVSVYDTPGSAWAVEVSGDLAFVADYNRGLQVIDISDPAAPTLAGTYNTMGTVRGVAVSGDLAFVADYLSGLQVIDISDPTNPVLAGAYNTTGNAFDVSVAGNLAFVADYGSGLQVIDISDPTNPALAGIYDTPGTAVGVTVAGNLAFVADLDFGLQVIRISDPVNPMLVASYKTQATGRDITVLGDLLFVADKFGLEVIDVSNPGSPMMTGSYHTPDEGSGVAVAGDLAFVAAFTSGLQLINISNPASPTLAGSYNMLGDALDVAVAGDLAFVADNSAGLQLIDVSNPASPTLAGSYDSPGTAYGIAVAGDLAFVADGGSGLQLVDISNPASPTLAGTYNTPGFARDVAVAGDLAFVADGGSGLQLVDISNPASPTLVGTYNTPGFASDVAVAGDLAFVADGSSGLQLIDISNPASPTLAGSYAVAPASDADGVAVAGGYAYMAGFFVDGLPVIQVFQHEVESSDNTSQSLVLDDATDTIIQARLSSTQSLDVFWELSADGGSNFQVFAPGDWAEFAAPGTDLLWRSTHTWAPPGGNPTVSEVTIEWLNEFARIETVADVGNDQGRQVSLEWSRSGHDFLGDTSQIAEYAVYRKIDPGLLHRATPDFSGYSPSVQEHAQLQATAGWHFMMTVPVRVEDRYAVVVPTLADSTIVSGDYLTTFMVSALTATPGVFFDSYPDSGRSIDNLAPLPPAGLTADYQADSVTLDWADAPESDLQYYRVYRDVTPDFAPSPANRVAQSANLVAQVTISSWTDMINNPWGYYYRVSAVDQSGNEGVVGEVVTVTGAPEATNRCRFALHEAVPNPFNPSTVIAYSIPSAGRVRLVIYNVAGREVRTIVDGLEDAGPHEVQWNGLDQAGSRAASGVYLYQLRAGKFVETRRMVLLK